MGKAERVELIGQIEAERGSHVITYLTSTRQGLEVQMAMDSVRKVYDHLRLLKKPRDAEGVKIDLFIHSNGGDGTVPWRLVTLIREFATEFAVLIPHKAFSAATLTALGADEIVMHPMGMLGPTDPTVTNAFNPPDPLNPMQRIGISVEDVSAYIALVKEDVGIRHEDELIQAFIKLAETVHPLALGNVKRSISQSRMMAKKLLALHMDTADEHKINEIVDNLTSKLFYHGHPINRVEAKTHLGIGMISDPPKKVEELMWKLYLEYETEMDLEKPFNVAHEFIAQKPGLALGATDTTPPTTAKLAYVESAKRTDVGVIEYELVGSKHPQNGVVSVQLSVLGQEWKVE